MERKSHFHMPTRKFQYFLALCDELSFGRAATRCSISQPTLTTAIHSLERVLGGALFIRRPKFG
jgi:DNA-binding transcriptional LysR family regulator